MEKQKKFSQCSKKINCVKCSSNEECIAWANFVQRHNECKSYAHFDERVSLALPSIREYVMDDSKVAIHSFYPFIHFSKQYSRYKKSGIKLKNRDLYYCSHLDRCVYQRYAFLVNQKYARWVKENNINNVAIAYRDDLEKNNINFARDAFDAIKDKKSSLIIVGDFTNFFDRLDHKYLKRMLCELLVIERLPPNYYAVFRNITRYASWDWKQLVEDSGENICEKGIRTKINNKKKILTKEQFQANKEHIKLNKSGKGIPQGSPISAVLSNVYMMQFDKDIDAYVKGQNGIYMRYSDDFIVILPYSTREIAEENRTHIFSYVEETMAGLVELQKEKTSTYVYQDKVIYSYEENEPTKIDYLGFWFDGNSIKLRPKAVTKYYYRMQKKAKTIGKNHWISPKKRHISAKNLYRTYSLNDERSKNRRKRRKGTFINYVKKAKQVLELDDSAADAIVKNHKRKIAQAIKKAEQESEIL